MGTYKSKGIVFRSMKYRETSLIIDIYTREKGLNSFIVNGVRSSKSKSKSNIFQLMNILEIVAYDKENKSLNRLKESKYSIIYDKLPYDVKRSSIGMLLMEISRNSIQETETNEVLYDFIEDWLLYLDSNNHSMNNLVLLYLVQLSAMLGFAPSLNNYEEGALFDMLEGRLIKEDTGQNTILNQDATHSLFELLNTKKEEAHLLKISPNIRRKLFDDLLKYYEIHISNFKAPKSVDILRQILA